MSSLRRNRFVLFLTLLLITVIACSVIPGTTQSSDLEQTRIALDLQGTSLAMERERLTQEAAQNNQNNQNQPEVPPAQPTNTNTTEPQPPAQEPTHTNTVTQTATVTSTATQEVSMDDLIKNSNVLIWEDIRGYMPLAGDPRVSDAVNSMGFTGRVVNVGDAMGDFKSHLLSGAQWDLIIVSAEVRDSIQGEFWDYMMEHINNKVALIAEVWYLDSTAFGKISPILMKCGIELQSNWDRPFNYNVLDYSILNLQPSHEIFTYPNQGVSLVSPTIFWPVDAGDLIKLAPTGDATLLSGLYFDHKSDYGLMAECVEGRVVFMTFSTHDYQYSQMIALWQNNIYYTLKNHYLAINP